MLFLLLIGKFGQDLLGTDETKILKMHLENTLSTELTNLSSK